jgi:hypothetical protein
MAVPSTTSPLLPAPSCQPRHRADHQPCDFNSRDKNAANDRSESDLAAAVDRHHVNRDIEATIINRDLAAAIRSSPISFRPQTDFASAIERHHATAIIAATITGRDLPLN